MQLLHQVAASIAALTDGNSRQEPTPRLVRAPREQEELVRLIAELRQESHHSASLVGSIAHDHRICKFEGYVRFQEEFSDSQWAAVWLHFHVGLSQEEIGRVLRLSRSAVSGRLTRAQRLRETLEKAAVRRMSEEMGRYLDP